ncbi:MAG: hypothetical protein E7463_04070 [Ruminococcaceae bacterium]|nr:hypothetical protein [Oscillospiraceae bacterium]
MIKFLLFADFHYDKAKHPFTVADLEKILQRGKDADVDFVMQCGDFCNDAINSPEIFKAYLENKHGFPVYGIYGNHEMEKPGNSMEINTPLLTNRPVEKPFPDASYWYTDIKGIRLIGLDSNFSLDPVTNQWEHAPSGRAGAKPGNINLAYVYPAEMQWLDGVLADAQAQGLKAILFSHHPLSGCFEWKDGNGAEVRALIGKYKHTAVMCISGDLHVEYFAVIDDVPYYSIPATRYLDRRLDWENAYPDELTFDYTEYDKDGNPLATYKKSVNDVTDRYYYFCDEPLSAIVSIDDEGNVNIEGMQSPWLGGIEPVNKGRRFPNPNFILNRSFKLNY